MKKYMHVLISMKSIQVVLIVHIVYIIMRKFKDVQANGAKMMNDQPTRDHVRNCMLYEFRKEKTAAEATSSINAVYPEAVDIRTCQRWFSRFREGNFDLGDLPRSGRPSDVNEDLLRQLIEEDPRQTLTEMETITGLDAVTISRHLKAIGKTSKAGIWVPYQLTDFQKSVRLTICKSLLSRHQNASFLDRIVTGDEKWVAYDNPKRKRQWLSRGEAPISTAKSNFRGKKVLLCVWWGMTGVIHYELLQAGQTVNAQLYCDQITRLNEKITEKLPALANRKGVILQHDNAKPHVAKRTQEKIKQLKWEVLPHPPYSPDVAPSDYHLFRSMQHYLVDKRFSSLEDAKKGLDYFFNSKTPGFYKSGIENLVRKWRLVIESDGDYFDK